MKLPATFARLLSLVFLVCTPLIAAPVLPVMRLSERLTAEASKIRLSSISDVLQAEAGGNPSGPVHVRGTVTYLPKTKGVFVQDEGSGVYLADADASGIAIGDIVDVVGINTREGIKKASLIKFSDGNVLAAAHPRYVDVADGKYHNELVSMSGTYMSQFQDGTSTTILFRVDGHVMTAYLRSDIPVLSIPEGSRIQVSGILEGSSEGAADSAMRVAIEMRSASDLRVASVPSWFNADRLEDILLFLIFALIAILRLRFFKRKRKADENPKANRAMEVARERSRILELISSNHSLDEVLAEICKSTRLLLPGAQCSYELKLDAKGKEIDLQGKTFQQSEGCFECPLVDSDEKVVGKIVVTSCDGRAASAEQEQVFALIAELAGLAMKQSLLFRGLVHRSNHDPLTSLPNRRYCESRMAMEIKEAEANGGRLALIYIDVNHFKSVNDTYGHRVGDLYLKAISERLTSQIRSIDTLARIGGDEFIVVAPFAELGDRSYALTSRLQECFQEPFDLEGARIDGSASFGLALYPDHGKTVEELTRHADEEMYVAKQAGAPAAGALDDLAIISSDELEIALLQGRFRLAYQPQFSVTGKMTGLEALIRLDDPVLGTITPDAFITVAERHPVIIKIGAWVLRTALEDAMRWELDRGDTVFVAVNVAVRQIEEPDFARFVLKLLEETGFPADRLELELVERSLMSGGSPAFRQLEQLRAAGVRIGLDDFGTGQSCLSLLHQCPVDTIKLDRSFIGAITTEPKVLPIIRAIVAMAHSLGKRVVAEAVETVEPVPALLEMGEMDFQGHLLSRPIPADHVHTFIQTMRSGIVMPQAFQQANREA